MVGRRQPSPKRMAVEKSRDRRSRLRAGSTLSAPAEEIGGGPSQAASRSRPFRRRAASTARPARVRIRSRNPCVLWRRRLLGWKVRLLTAGLHEVGDCRQTAVGHHPARAGPLHGTCAQAGGQNGRWRAGGPIRRRVVARHAGSCSGRRHASRNRCAQRLAELAAKLLASAPTEALPRFERQRYRRRRWSGVLRAIVACAATYAQLWMTLWTT